MLPLGVALGLIRALLAAAFLAQSVGTRVVCVASDFFFEEETFELLTLFFGVALAVMLSQFDEAERGGEGGRPVDGAR